jgi:hypothetical protein
MNSTLTHGLNFIATQQIKQIINNLNSNSDNYSTIVLPYVYTKKEIKETSPFITVTPVNNTTVQYNYGRYSDLNKNKSVQKKIIKYFLYKILDKWIYNEYKSILGFIKLDNGNPVLIRSMSDYKPENVSNDSAENIEKRINYLEKIIINSKLVKHVLKKIITENNVQWIQLNKHKSMIKKVLKKYIVAKLEQAIKSV